MAGREVAQINFLGACRVSRISGYGGGFNQAGNELIGLSVTHLANGGRFFFGGAGFFDFADSFDAKEVINCACPPLGQFSFVIHILVVVGLRDCRFV